jgi:hypothetical protein
MLKARIFSRSALAVAFMLLYRHMNRRTGRCDPSVSMLADETGLPERSINRATAELRKSAWWRIKEGGGRGHTNSYQPRWETLTATSPFRGGKGDTHVTVSGAETLTRVTVNPDTCVTRTSKNQNHTVDLHRPVARSARSRARAPRVDGQGAASGEFDTFWQIYPHRGRFSDPKKPARLKFEAAIKRGVDPAAIIAGAERYRAHVEQEGIEPRFVAQAATWLHQERWAQLHEPEAPRLKVGMN